MPPVGFELETNRFQFYAIANLDKTSLTTARSCGLPPVLAAAEIPANQPVTCLKIVTNSRQVSLAAGLSACEAHRTSVA